MKTKLIPLLFFSVTACTSGNDNDAAVATEPPMKEKKVSEYHYEDDEKVETFNMSNPAFMMGTNIGSLFNVYYKIGDFEKMLCFTDSASLRKYGRENLKKYYRKADLGMDMKLKNMTSEENEEILHYELVVNATKVIKRLHVIIEKDTVRVVPQHPESGKIFE
jgi:hypothetical protein